MTDTPPEESTHTVIIGASAAGLATACCLKKAGIEHVLLERSDHVAHAWRNHYERLHLHTSKGLSELPHHPWPAEVARYPPRAEVVRYMEDYSRRFDLQPRFGQSVRRVSRCEAGWRVETDGHVFEAKNVVVATGYSRVPHEPSWPGMDEYGGDVVHSSRYTNGDPWKGRRVLVVGFGNSACEIAIDLHERGAEPTISVRGGVNILPRDVLGIPILGLGIATSALPAGVVDFLAAPISRLSVGDLRALGLEPLPYGPNRQIREHGRIPLLDIGTVALIKDGSLAVRKGIDRFTADGVVFADGREEPFAAVVLGTGYRPAVDEFLAEATEVCEGPGVPRSSGVEALSGLFFCGFHVSPTGMLRAIANEAQAIAHVIASR
jgi:cation diffusion facilitator CzcD-associated flavoprotein CzcO